MRILFLGTPLFAAHPLRQLVAAGHDVVAVVTQPDRPVGRSRMPQPSPVKQAALELGLTVVQPETLRDEMVIGQLRALQPDVGVVAAYGEILRRAVLDIPPFGYLNIHPSLLPLYRGPAPVTATILNGDAVAGVSVIRLERAMDAGPILAQATVALDCTERVGVLTDQLFELGAGLLVGLLPQYIAGKLVLSPQDHNLATFTKMISRDDGRLDWSLPAVALERAVRAYDPWPGTWTLLHGQSFKILAASVVGATSEEAPGIILPGSKLQVATGAGILQLDQIQPAGKRAMAGDDWRRGQPAATGIQLGS